MERYFTLISIARCAQLNHTAQGRAIADLVMAELAWEAIECDRNKPFYLRPFLVEYAKNKNRGVVFLCVTHIKCSWVYSPIDIFTATTAVSLMPRFMLDPDGGYDKPKNNQFSNYSRPKTVKKRDNLLQDFRDMLWKSDHVNDLLFFLADDVAGRAAKVLL